MKNSRTLNPGNNIWGDINILSNQLVARRMLMVYVIPLFLLIQCETSMSKFSPSSQVYESDIGPIDDISVDTASGDLALACANSITRLNFDRLASRTYLLRTGVHISAVKLLTSRKKSFVFICVPQERKCSFLTQNASGLHSETVADVSKTFPWTQDGSFITSLYHGDKSEILFMVNNVETNYSSAVFSLWNVSYEPASMTPLNSGLSDLKLVSPYTFAVMLAFQYNNKLYYMVKTKPRRRSRRSTTSLLQVDLTDTKHRIVATKLRCTSASVVTTGYYLGQNPEILYASFEIEGTRICGFKMSVVEQYFQKVQEDCKLNRRGSRITWLEETLDFSEYDTHIGLNPCYRYKFGTSTRPEINHEAIFAASSLYPTITTTEFPTLGAVESLLVFRQNNRTIGFVANQSGVLSKILLDMPGTVLYSTEMIPANEPGKEWTTQLRLHKDRLYIVRKNIVQYIDIESCRRHKMSTDCLRDVISCSWCKSSNPKSSLFVCKSSETCENPRGYMGPPPKITSVEPSEGRLSGGIVMTIHGTDLDMVRTPSVTVNTKTCDVIRSSINPSGFNCIVPSLTDSSNFISHTVPVLVTLDSKSYSPSNLKFTYLKKSFILSYTPWTSIESGGTKLILTGENLHVIQHVKLTYYKEEEKVSQGEQPCLHKEKKVICFTPTLVVNDQLPVNVSLRLSYNGVINGSDEIFYPTPSTLRSSIFSDPVIYGFKHEDSVTDRIEVDINENILVIVGNGFDSVMIDEYKITILPRFECQILNMSDDTITCEIETSTSLSPPTLDVYHSLKVQIGLNLLFYPGFVSFYNVSEDIPPLSLTKVYINTTEIVTNKTSVIRTVTTNKTVVITNSSGSFTHRESNKGVVIGEPTINSLTDITTTASKPMLSTTLIHTKSTEMTVRPATKENENNRTQLPVSGHSQTNNDTKSDWNAIVPALCVCFVSVVAILVFRKPLIRKLKQKLRSRSRPDDGMSDGDRDDISYSIAPGGATYSLESLGGYTAETVLSDDDQDDDVCFQHFYKRFEDSNLIVRREALKTEKIIGQGNFGSVFKGLLTQYDTEVVVAVKSMHKNSSRDLDIRAFLKEAYVMKHFHHENVLELLGVCVDDATDPLVLLPFMPHGDLLKYLHDENNLPTVKDLVCFGLDIANGMEYLAKLKFVHRDLAARNCMLDSKYHVKVADFGLSRDIYETSYYSTEKKGKLPVKWMALESLATGVFNEKTDVWAFGVTLWELMTRGVRPYAAVDNWDIEKYLRTGRRLPHPLFCPTHLYKLMRKCWLENPADRPTFTTLKEWIATMLDRVEHPLGDTNHATNIATTYVNVAMGSQYKYDPD